MEVLAHHVAAQLGTITNLIGAVCFLLLLIVLQLAVLIGLKLGDRDR